MIWIVFITFPLAWLLIGLFFWMGFNVPDRYFGWPHPAEPIISGVVVGFFASVMIHAPFIADL